MNPISISEKFEMGTELTYVVRTVLVLSTSSADAERMFSVMNHIKTKVFGS